eukprot:2307299-Amphidinium_carterae.1
MSCSVKDLADLRRQLASMEKLLGGKPAGTQQPNNKKGAKGRGRGGGKSSQDESAGWYCSRCKKYNKGSKPSCYNCEWARPQEDGPGKPAPPQPAPALESMLKKHLAAAKDPPALQGPLQKALLAVQQQKRDALPVSDRRAHLCAQVRTLAGKMDQQTKIAQDAMAMRDKLKEELITVYLRLSRLVGQLASTLMFELMSAACEPEGAKKWGASSLRYPNTYSCPPLLRATSLLGVPRWYVSSLGLVYRSHLARSFRPCLGPWVLFLQPFIASLTRDLG